MVATLVMSTDDVSRGERASYWRDWVWRHFGGLESDLYGDTEFAGSMSAGLAGEVVLTRLRAGRHRVLRTRSTARTGETAYLKIVAPWVGTACVRQSGRRATIGPGEWVIYDTTGAYQVDSPQVAEHLIVMVPKVRVAESGLDLGRLTGRPMGGVRGVSRLALEAMRSASRFLDQTDAPPGTSVGDAIADLVRQSLLELDGRETSLTQREALRDRIRGYVGRHLRDPDLTVDRIAAGLNCSRRHLYNAFAGEGESIAAFIQRSRLEACVRDLQQIGPYARPVTDIALSWGFGNLSHFSRLFREHTGASPTAFRSARVPTAATPLGVGR